ncbi:IQ DOMAIN-CONTAINING PROTEIN IQM3 [Salix purpurea]|nr:IQ DOMAIN-CONTAINING PROTEIN IQM3 [Salix purpurea]
MDTLKSQCADMSAKCERSPERRNHTMLSKIGAVVRVQQLYRGYRTRRRLADSAVIAQELWWQAIYHADLNENTVSFFKNQKSESAASRWKRVGSHASKVGKGLSKHAESEKLYFEHWIEA